MSQVEQKNSVKLSGIILFKEGMSTIFDSSGEAVPVTVLRYEPWVVSQVKSNERDGYSAVQLACEPLKEKNSNLAMNGHLKGAGFPTGARFLKELRLKEAEVASVGDVLSIESVSKGDFVKMTSRSKGKGFAGSVKRWNFAGGPASHGSKFHRRPGSSGNRTWPGRVMPGKRFPGHLGDETVTVRNIQVVDVLPEQNVVLVKGPVPGSRNSLVRLIKE